MTSSTADPAAGMTVVVPVRGRISPLRELLASYVVARTHCAEPTELIVVDDTNSPESAEHQANCARFGARYLAGPSHVGAKRNLGARSARYDLVCFIDSDCRLTADLLSRHVKTLRAATDGVVVGVAGPTSVQRGETTVFRIISRSPLLNGDHEKPTHYHRITWATTSNLALRRNAFLDCGGFPEDSPHPLGAEDVELGLRLAAHGGVIVCDADAEVIHSVQSSDNLRSLCRRLTNYGRSEQWLCAVHPERRRFRPNPLAVLAALAAGAAGLAPYTRGRSLLSVPAATLLLIARRSRQLLAGDHSAAAIVDSAACSALELLFDLGALGGALEQRDPRLLLHAFRGVDDEPYLRPGRDDR